MMEDKVNQVNAAGGVDYLHSYYSSRPLIDYNKCGQAAIATILDFYGLDPYGLGRTVYDAYDGKHHWKDGQIIDRIKKNFPPDKFFGLFGTTGARISEALAHFGLQTRLAHSANPSVGREIWEDVKRQANAGFPVVVIMDRGKLGGRPFTAHWGVVHKVADSEVRLATCGGMPVVPESYFVRAFRCRFMPASFNHCAVFSRIGAASNDPS